eukprot:3107524-Heterocapsa_arctica.AAC.1
MTLTYLDIARSYEMFLCPEVGQEGSNHELRRESGLCTGRAAIDLDPEEQEEMTYLDTARSYERFRCPEVGQEGSTHEPRRESAPRTERT